MSRSVGYARWLCIGGCLIAPLALAAPEAASPPAPGNLLTESAAILLKLFVLAAVLESALAVLFNWRPFVAIFDGRGAKTIIAVAASILLVNQLDLDVMGQLAKLYDGKEVGDGWVTSAITALVIAGGSSGVSQLLHKLGWRELVRAEELRPRPSFDQAWLSVSLREQRQSTGIVQVEISAGNGPFAIVGSLHKRAGRSSLLRYFLRDSGRLPPSGGLPMALGTPLRVRLSGAAKTPGAAPTIHSEIWTTEALAPGAVVDIELSL